MNSEISDLNKLNWDAYVAHSEVSYSFVVHLSIFIAWFYLSYRRRPWLFPIDSLNFQKPPVRNYHERIQACIQDAW